MEIKTIIRYQFAGKEYSTLQGIKKEVENQIGAILDKVTPHLPPKQALNLLEIIVKNKTQLSTLLNIRFEIEPNNFQDTSEKNILDL